MNWGQIVRMTILLMIVNFGVYFSKSCDLLPPAAPNIAFLRIRPIDLIACNLVVRLAFGAWMSLARRVARHRSGQKYAKSNDHLLSVRQSLDFPLVH